MGIDKIDEITYPENEVLEKARHSIATCIFGKLKDFPDNVKMGIVGALQMNMVRLNSMTDLIDDINSSSYFNHLVQEDSTPNSQYRDIKVRVIDAIKDDIPSREYFESKRK